jgi:outer membrane protein OmpA-like peptidoglycan-associated protein
MNSPFRAIVAVALGACACASIPAMAQERVATDAYALDANGRIVKSAFGLCWRTAAWTPAKAIAECDPDLVAKPAPVAAPPAPVAAPVAPPAPKPTARVLDSDGDGVPDDSDKCPGTPAGAKVNAQGCEPDSDGDGVVDRLDKCPGTAAGAKVDAQGCELDSDGDGVVDRLDKCPGTRTGAKVDATGCEIPDAVVLKGVNFATNSARLTAGSTAILDEAAATLIKRGDVKTEVAGHTDNRGSPARNQALSQQRAEAVMRYLVSKGVNPANLTARGYGQDSPIANNATESGRTANRRVELRAIR